MFEVIFKVEIAMMENKVISDGVPNVFIIFLKLTHSLSVAGLPQVGSLLAFVVQVS